MMKRGALWIGTAVSIALLAAFVFLFVDVGEMWEVMRGANYLYVLPALVLYTVSLLSGRCAGACSLSPWWTASLSVRCSQ